jgi:hypothetical protein
MSKFLLNHLVQISKALVNSKNPIFNAEILFFTFGPADLAAHSAVGPAGPVGLSPLPQASPSRSAHACHWPNCRNMFSSLIHAFRSWRLLCIHPLPHGVRFVFSTAPADPGRDSSMPPLPAIPHHSPLNPPSNRALTSLNGLNHHSPPSLLRPPLRCPPDPYKSPRGPPELFTPHRASPISSPALKRPLPPSFPTTTELPRRPAATPPLVPR